MGNVVQAGLGQNPARQAALNGGLTDRVAALTINKVCGSGLKAVMLAAQGIATGDIDIAVAGGMESMSNAPYLLPRVREGLRMGNGELVDSMIHDGLWCAFENCHMGMSGEVVAGPITSAAPSRTLRRREPPEGGARHARRAGSTTRSCRVRSRRRRARRVVIDRDEPIREDTTAEALARAEAGVQEGRHRDRRQRAGRQRRRRGARRHGGRQGAARSA